MARNRTAVPDERLTILNRVLASCAETREMIRKCKNCGINVDKEEMRNNEQEQFATKLKREFYPTAS